MDCPVECFLIGLRRLRRPSYLPHILQSRIMHLSLTRRRLKVVQRSDVSTHAPIVHCSRSDTRYSTIVLRVAKRRTGRALLGPPPLCSVGLTELTPEAKTLESSPAQAAHIRKHAPSLLALARPALPNDRKASGLSARDLRGRTRKANQSASQNRTRSR